MTDTIADEIRSQAFTDLDWHLDNWARWMRWNDDRLGLPKKASGGLQCYTGMDRDSDGANARLDAYLAEHADAAINALSITERAALYQAYGMSAVWRFPRNNFDELYADARAKVRSTLLRRGVVVT